MKTNYTASQVNEIVMTINAQINATTRKSIIWSWGVSRRFATIYNDMASLGLRVSGCLHKGYVYVAYDEGCDLYNVYIVNMKGVVKNESLGVFCDEIGAVIDAMIERAPEITDDEYKTRAMADSRRKFSKC